MVYYPRFVDLNKLVSRKSILFFGPRSTGKTSLIKNQLADYTMFDLLDTSTYTSLLREPGILFQTAQSVGPDTTVVVDEIQKLPQLLDEVHRTLNELDITFLLTGSSARKLKRGGANLLAGRAWQAELYPLSYIEIPDFDLFTYLNRGGLPEVLQSDYPEEELRSYVGTYLTQEIVGESLTRNLPAFSRFLDIVGLSNGQEINYQSLASDAGVSPNTLKNYLGILEDTLLGFSLPGYTKTTKRKATSRAKHYLFDIGVVNQLCNRGEIKPRSEMVGAAFEHFIVAEARAHNSYSRNYQKLSYWRSKSKFEVDLLIGDKLAVEVKSTDLVQSKHLKGLRALKEEQLIESYCVVSQDENSRITDDGIRLYHWETFLTKLWNGQLV